MSLAAFPEGALTPEILTLAENGYIPWSKLGTNSAWFVFTNGCSTFVEERSYSEGLSVDWFSRPSVFWFLNYWEARAYALKREAELKAK